MKSEEFATAIHQLILFLQKSGSKFFTLHSSLFTLKFFTLHSSLFTLLFSLLLLLSCTGEQQYSTSYPCSFAFYASNHPNCVLSLSLASPGQFVIVVPQLKSGVTHLMMTPNLGEWTEEQKDVKMVTAIENERLNYDNMGANRRLIVGCSNFNGLKCFDGQCPNCLLNGTLSNYPLSWTDRGQMLVCQKCSRKYNPNAEGIPTNGGEDDRRLIEYRIEFNGDRLFCHN